jgi:hypothetical protein
VNAEYTGRRERAVDTDKWRRRTTMEEGQILWLEALVFTVLKVMVFAPFFVSNGSKLWDLTVGTSFAILSMMRIQSNIYIYIYLD